MPASPSDYHAYMLRLWRSGPGGPWRASLEDAETGQRMGFGSLSEAYAYLLAKTHVGTEGSGGDKPPQASGNA